MDQSNLHGTHQAYPRSCVPPSGGSRVSMLKFPVSEGKHANLLARMRDLQVAEGQIEESYFRVSGPGGQKTNKTASGVTLLHRPTGIQVRCQRERSQGINRFLARRLLVEELEARQTGKTRHEVKAERLREEKDRRCGSHKNRPAPAPKPSLGFDLAKAMGAYYLRPLSP